jgi:dTDP-4-amino-4,6-dideoxygalactose transaminase
MADMEKISIYARNNGIICLEDCAQALGASISNRKAGTYGDYSIFSFHTQKNITTLGEGGALVVNDLNQAARVPGLIHNGVAAYSMQDDYWIPAMNNIVADPEGVIPFNFCLTEVQALIGSMLINRVDALNYDRIIRANKFIKALEGCYELSFQSIPKNYKHVFHLLSARYDSPKEGVNRNDLIRLLADKYGIKCIVQYQPLYRYDLFKRHGFGDANCPECDNFFDNMISFPFYHWMPNSDFEYLIESIKSAIILLRN